MIVLFADAVVVWRMWVLCGATSARKVLSIPLTLLWATSLTIMATIGLRVYISSLPENEQVRSKRLESILNIPQVASVVFSLGTNITATLVIAWRAWVYRQDMRGIIRTGSDLPRLEGILVLFVESGLLFCVSSTFRFLGMFVRFSFDCTLGDIYGPTHSQIAGMYPALVMVMLSSRAERSRSLQPPLESIVSGIIGVIVTM
ncbi:hypothetical protein BC629DRAFT_1551586 [Irpex lacteus]|nr:hypothetical protein BC629DRAFT_1551586 [Irpex lacteus]